MGEQSRSEAAIYDMLRKYEGLCAAVREINTARGDEFVSTLTRSLTQVRECLEKKPRPVPLNKIASGLRQGLRETPLILRDLLVNVSPSAQAKVWAALHDAGTSNLSGLLTQENKKLRGVLRRGTIRSEDEWYLLRWRLDQIEGHPEYQSEIVKLNKMLGAYEAVGREIKRT